MRRVVDGRNRLSAHEAAKNTDLFVIDWRACRFGGKRPYVHCPRCPRAVLHLYQLGNWFACRSCVGLAYGSQMEGRAARRRRSARKVREKLQAGDNLCIPVTRFPRPKHMQERTWLRLREKAMRLEMAALGDIEAFMRRMKG